MNRNLENFGVWSFSVEGDFSVNGIDGDAVAALVPSIPIDARSAKRCILLLIIDPHQCKSMNLVECSHQEKGIQVSVEEFSSMIGIILDRHRAGILRPNARVQTRVEFCAKKGSLKKDARIWNLEMEKICMKNKRDKEGRRTKKKRRGKRRRRSIVQVGWRNKPNPEIEGDHIFSGSSKVQISPLELGFWVCLCRVT